MTDKEKLEKIRSEVIWYIHLRNKGLIIGSCGDFEKLLKFIDSIQEEPTTSVWHDISEKPKLNSIIVMNNSQTTLSVEYVGQSLCGVERWAYLDILLKL